MTQRVLTPLGLDDSFFGTSVARLSTGAVRYDYSGNPIPYYATATPASGELYACAHDLARFAIFNMKHCDRARILGARWIGVNAVVRYRVFPISSFDCSCA